MVEIAALAFPLVVDPMPLKVIATPFGEDPIATPASHVPEPLIDIAVGVDHPALPMRLVIQPHAIIPIVIGVEHSASPILPVVFVVPCVFPA